MEEERSSTSLTDDFCQTFPTKESCEGPAPNAMCRIMAGGIDYIPMGVNVLDPRVKQIVKWCQELYPQNIREKVDD